MTFITTDGSQCVDVGTYEIINSILSTIEVRIPNHHKNLELAISFLRYGKCESKLGLDTAKSVNHLRDALSKVSPEKLVYDSKNVNKAAPWEGDISPVITSCANYFTTADGKGLLAELVVILTYAFYAKADVEMQ